MADSDHWTALFEYMRAQCIAAGMKLPFVACCLSVSGRSSIWHIPESGDPLEKAGMIEDAPVSILIVDQRNVPALFTKTPVGALTTVHIGALAAS
jgi:hypothetical protein